MITWTEVADKDLRSLHVNKEDDSVHIKGDI